MKDIRVVFLGTPRFACAVLQSLIDEKYHIVGVVAQPDKPVGRKKEILPTPVHALADANGIPFAAPVRLRKEYDSLLAFQPDLIVTCAYGQIVPDPVLAAPKYGCVNVHPSLLPKYRGGAPVHHAVWNGDAETGVSIMEMVSAMDAGNVYAQCTVPILPDETTEELNLELEKASVSLLKDTLPHILYDGLKGTPQDESKVVLARNISSEQEQIHFETEPVDELYNHVRALIDWPISYGILEGRRIKFFKARKEDRAVNEKAGTIIGFSDHAMLIACNGGILKVYDLQMEGKTRMSADVFANGAGRSLTGKVFE